MWIFFYILWSMFVGLYSYFVLEFFVFRFLFFRFLFLLIYGVFFLIFYFWVSGIMGYIIVYMCRFYCFYLIFYFLYLFGNCVRVCLLLNFWFLVSSICVIIGGWINKSYNLLNCGLKERISILFLGFGW